MENKELTVVEQQRGLETYRMSTDAASMCKEIVIASAQDIKGKKYVRVEGWQAIAIAHGCTASSGDVERTETGYRAIGKVIRMSDGMVLSSAEGFVGDDEETWGKRPEYARRAMAQTRAISRACRSAFAHVVVMMKAGLSTTPAEEVPQEGFDQHSEQEPQRGRTISEGQAKRFFAIAKGTGASNDAVKAWLKKEFGFDHSKDITVEVYDDICERAKTELVPQEAA